MATQTMPRFDLDVEPAAAERDSPPEPHSASPSAPPVHRDERALREEAYDAPPEAWHVLAEVDRRGGIRFTAAALEFPAGTQPAARTHSQRRST